MEELPQIQQRALSAAMLLTDGPTVSPGNRVVGVAVLGVLRALAQTGPLLLAIDDIQWHNRRSSRARWTMSPQVELEQGP